MKEVNTYLFILDQKRLLNKHRYPIFCPTLRHEDLLDAATKFPNLLFPRHVGEGSL